MFDCIHVPHHHHWHLHHRHNLGSELFDGNEYEVSALHLTTSSIAQLNVTHFLSFSFYAFLSKGWLVIVIYWSNFHGCLPEIDISVSKLLGFETFAKSLRVSVSENLVSEKKSRFRFRKNLVSEKSLGFGKFGFGKKVSVSVSKKIGIGKRSRSRFRKMWSRKRKKPSNKNSVCNDKFQFCL